MKLIKIQQGTLWKTEKIHAVTLVKYINRKNVLHLEKCAAYVIKSITLAQFVCHQLLTRKNSIGSPVLTCNNKTPPNDKFIFYNMVSYDLM